VQRISSLTNANEILVAFTEPVDQATATNTTNYAVSDGINITDAQITEDLHCVWLTVSPALGTGQHKMTIKNVKDRALAPNTMDDLVDVPFQHEPIPGLIGYWSFDILPDAGIKDLSQTKFDGTSWDDLHPGIKRVTGRIGQAVYLDGIDDFVDINRYTDSTETALVQTQPLNQDSGTVACWFKADMDIPSYKRHIFCKDLVYDLQITSGVLRFGNQSTGKNVVDNKWHHAVLTFKSGVSNATRVYLDGLPVFTGTHNISNYPNLRQGLGIGRGGGGYGQPRFFKGAIDEFMIFNRPLTQAEVMQLAQKGPTGIFGSAVKPVSDVMKLSVFPNPFSTSVNIKCSVRNEKLGIGIVKIAVYDIKGKLVYSQLPIPNSQLGWDSSNHPSGIYLVKVRVGNQILTKKITLLK
jgi:hypothetical protein